MVVRNAKDFWAGLMFVGFGLAFVVIAMGTPDLIDKLWGGKIIPGYQMGSAVRMGPAYFPVVLGGMLATLGALVLARSFASKLPAEETEVRIPFTVLDLLIAVGVFALMTYIAKWLQISHDYAMLASALSLSLLSIFFKPDTKALTLILASSLAFAYLLKPLGLVLAGIALVFISAFGGHEFKWKEVAILAVVLVIFSVLVFVKGLTLPFPICPSFVEICPIR
jgi:hypothetical protein